MSSDNPEGREKLLRAKSEIEEVIARYGMVGHYVIALPHQTETALVLGAPWCVASVEHVDEHRAAIRVRSKRADYVGREAEREEMLAATTGALHLMGALMGSQAMTLIETANKMSEHLGAEFGPLELVRKQ